MPSAYFGTLVHTVLPGSTLSTIAFNYNTTVENILKFNRIPNVNQIFSEQKIIVPLSPPEAIIYAVNPGDTLYSIALKHGTLVANLIRFNYLIPPYYIYPGQKLVVTASLRKFIKF
jgi:LysM repeat protein